MLAKEISVKRYVVRLSGEERERLEPLLRKGKSPAQRLLKARILVSPRRSCLARNLAARLCLEVAGQDSSVRHYRAFRPLSRFSRPGELARVLAGSHFRRVRHRKADFCDAHHILKATAALASRVSMESRIMGE